MQAAGILGNRPPPGDRQRQEQGVETGVVKPFAEVAAGRQDDAFFALGDGRQLRERLLQLLPTHATAQNDKVTRHGRKSLNQ